MKRLKDLIEGQKFSDISDIEIIKQFFVLNDMEEDGIGIINDLVESKVRKLRRKNYMAEEWVCMLPYKYLYKTYSLEIADKLHLLELDYLTYGGELSKNHLKWAKENLPNVKEPEVYFRPLIEYLKENGIEYKK